MTSYLSNRWQYVTYNNVSSPTKNITCSVPQITILGALTFLMNISDLVNVFPSLIPILFTDNTNIYLEGVNINEVTVKMNAGMVLAMDRINANKLSLKIRQNPC